MEITDKNGNVIEITDLNAAIEEANFGRDCRHEDEFWADFDDKQNAYWQDRYDKLLLLKKKEYYVAKYIGEFYKPDNYDEIIGSFNNRISKH